MADTGHSPGLSGFWHPLTVWISHPAQCWLTMIIPLTASPGPPWPPTLTSLTDTRRKGCDELANVFRIFFKSNLRDPEHEHVVDLWTPSSQSFMTRVSLTNCQLNCCPLPQPGPVFALVCHIMCHWSPPPPPALLTSALVSQVSGRSKQLEIVSTHQLSQYVLLFLGCLQQ